MVETARRIVLATMPEGAPSPVNFRIEHGPLPEPGRGQFLFRTLWLSMDPYLLVVKGYVDVGAVMDGGGVAEVVQSNLPDWRPGDLFVGETGWVSHGVSDGNGMRRLNPAAAPVSTALGVLGMPGHTAWFGLNRVAQGAAGEAILVSAATGAVGSLVVQLARRKGMRVVGVAGSPAKCAFAVEELGCEACLDHRAAADAAALSARIAAAIPEGIDVYFDNVGGKTLAAVLPNMKRHGRIAACGAIASYSGDDPAGELLGPAWRLLAVKRLSARGFIIDDDADTFPEFLAEVAPLVRDGSILYRESVADGLEAAPEALVGLLRGENFGKQLVRVAAEPG